MRRIIIHNHLPVRDAVTRHDVQEWYKLWQTAVANSEGTAQGSQHRKYADMMGDRYRGYLHEWQANGSKDTADVPYQFTEGKTAAEEGKAANPPYPEKSVPRDWWLRGYKSVKKA